MSGEGGKRCAEDADDEPGTFWWVYGDTEPCVGDVVSTLDPRGAPFSTGVITKIAGDDVSISRPFAYLDPSGALVVKVEHYCVRRSTLYWYAHVAVTGPSGEIHNVSANTEGYE
jgi:hypothetical protein